MQLSFQNPLRDSQKNAVKAFVESKTGTPVTEERSSKNTQITLLVPAPAVRSLFCASPKLMSKFPTFKDVERVQEIVGNGISNLGYGIEL